MVSWRLVIQMRLEKKYRDPQASKLQFAQSLVKEEAECDGQRNL